MGEITDYTDLDLYNQSPATVGKQNQIINALENIFQVGDMSSAVINVGAGTSGTIIEGVYDQEIWVYGWYVGASVASGSYTWFSDLTPKTGIIPVGINGGGTITSIFPIFKCGNAEDLILTAVGSDIDGIVQYALV